MTHIKNIPHILKNGITHKNALNSNQDYITIGDLSLIETRNNKQVTIDNGALYNVNLPSIILGNFTPFYFGVKMPMLYVIQNGGNFVEKATQATEIIYLACSLKAIINADLNCYFTDGHATDGLTSFYDKSKIDNLSEIIDWNSVKAPYWGGQENLNIKRKKQAEFLLQGDLSSTAIIGFGCSDNLAKQQLVNLGIDELKIKIIPDAYY